MSGKTLIRKKRSSRNRPAAINSSKFLFVAVMTRTVSASGMDWAVLAAAGTLTILPGAVVIWFVRHYIAKGFAMGRV